VLTMSSGWMTIRRRSDCRVDDNDIAVRGYWSRKGSHDYIMWYTLSIFVISLIVHVRCPYDIGSDAAFW